LHNSQRTPAQTAKQNAPNSMALNAVNSVDAVDFLEDFKIERFFPFPEFLIRIFRK
jgi:hypothetical protein